MGTAVEAKTVSRAEAIEIAKDEAKRKGVTGEVFISSIREEEDVFIILYGNPLFGAAVAIDKKTRAVTFLGKM